MVSVDKEKCIGCGACVAVCSEVFELTSEGKAKVKDSYAGGNEECIDQAVSICPVQAIKKF
ncbi:ferredoxin [Candidatus Micrarchaeota archaeon]|jgi:ferredoxin|nr:ferredoxin [Candidatus Micrarchaeota archaeon]